MVTLTNIDTGREINLCLGDIIDAKGIRLLVTKIGDAVMPPVEEESFWKLEITHSVEDEEAR